jgi:hypothetical protein
MDSYASVMEPEILTPMLLLLDLVIHPTAGLVQTWSTATIAYQPTIDAPFLFVSIWIFTSSLWNIRNEFFHQQTTSVKGDSRLLSLHHTAMKCYTSFDVNPEFLSTALSPLSLYPGTLSQCLTLSIVCLHSCLLSVGTTLRVTKLHITQQHRKLIPSYRPFDPSSADIITTLVTDFTAHQDLLLSYVCYMGFLKYCFYLV